MTGADQTEPAAWKARLPNTLTGLRLVLALVFFVLLTPYRYAGTESADIVLLAALALFVIAAVTDALDGHFARRWNVVSRFGRVMDPVADKVLVLGAFVYLAGPGFTAAEPTPIQISGVAPWMVVVILARELLVSAIRAVLEADGVSFPAVWSGKLKMILQSVAVPIILLTLAVADAGPGSVGRTVILVAVWATVVVTILSGVPYVRRALAVMRSMPREQCR